MTANLKWIAAWVTLCVVFGVVAVVSARCARVTQPDWRTEGASERRSENGELCDKIRGEWTVHYDTNGWATGYSCTWPPPPLPPRGLP